MSLLVLRMLWLALLVVRIGLRVKRKVVLRDLAVALAFGVGDEELLMTY